MRKTLPCLLALGAVLAAGQVSAKETWDPYLRGVDEGMPNAALPPPGVYGVLNNYWASYSVYDSKGKKTGTQLDSLVEVPILLWSTGLQIFGADYAVAIAQGFDYTNLKAANTASLSNNAHWGTYNTVIVPAILSWKLQNGFFIKAGLEVYVDDASSTAGHPPSGGGVPSGNGFWTLQPDLAVTWMNDGWNLSLDAHYDYNFEDGKTHYKSGQSISVDYTIAKTIDKWTFGVGAHQQNQFTSDSGSGATAAGCATKNGCKAINYGIGPLVSYQFPSVNLLFMYNHNLHAENDVAGDIFNFRLVAPF